MDRTKAALYQEVKKFIFKCVMCGDETLAVAIDRCLACEDPNVKKVQRKARAQTREKSQWKASTRKRPRTFPYEVAPSWIKVVKSKGWQGGFVARWIKSKTKGIPIKGNPKAQGKTLQAATRALLKKTKKQSHLKISINASLEKKQYGSTTTKQQVRKGITKKEFVMKKFNSKTTKSVLIKHLVKEGFKKSAIEDKTNKQLLSMIHNQEKPKMKKKAKKKTSKKRKTNKKSKKKTTKKVSKKAKKKVKTKVKRKGKAKLQKNGRPVADGERTSKPGALQHFRELWSRKKAKKWDREKLVDYMIKSFGPKARHSANNYISLAKKGMLQGCPTLIEKNGSLTKRGGKR